ncbi:MAG: hypothetical protein KKF46_05085 [Nanoarchaeota archaeon]|nr:hypothetical protein [Nanoarchaeota archaeon]MBU1321708.1 hypothetical protein [Nanoarchaeota archaeon]MBU1597288.1 hypothetical protein [Nanoarchaeota archaeon]MBU2442252.1 hypothetical protein [Nanoarchaeota archaeon]
MSDTAFFVKGTNYHGSSYLTEHNSCYGLSKKGKFRGRESIEGADIAYMAGLDPFYYRTAVKFMTHYDPEVKKQLDELIKEKGQEIQPGLIIVASLTDESGKERNRNGIVTSLVDKMLN